MPNRFLRYGDQRYLITKEAEARLNRALDKVYDTARVTSGCISTATPRRRVGC